jgi:mannose-1-phosphate guanylyltransferase
MQALILVGGEGTRLRPLTSPALPKPVVPLVDRPFLAYMLEWLARHGADDVIMSCGFGAGAVRDALGDGSAFGVKLRFVEEPEPRGTAGALKYAEEFLDERFLMLNGDVLTDMDLTAQIAQHEATGAKATLALVPVDDPTRYGLVRTTGDNAVTGFLEKPSPDQIDTNLISAGAYVLERSIVDLIEPDRNVSIEREVWPQLVGQGVYAFPHEHAYWLDIGTPETYLKGTVDILEGFVKTEAVQRIGDGCEIAPDAHVASTAVLGAGVKVGAETRIERSVVLAGCDIGEHCQIADAILAPGVRVGDRSTVSDGAVLGADVDVGADNVLSHGVKLFAGTVLADGAVKF